MFKRKYNYFPFSMKDVAASKWWHFFIDFANKTKLDDGMEEKFMSRLFDTWTQDSKLYPFVLAQEHARNVEGDIYDMKVYKTVEMTEKDFIVETLRKASMWSKQNKIEENKIGKFLTNNVCITRALRGEYYKPIFLFSKPFIERYGELSEEDLLKKASLRTFNKDVYELIKKSLGDDFVETEYISLTNN